MKKLLAFICLTVCIVLAGCDGGNYTVILHPDGSITEMYFIANDMKYFTDAGASPSEYNNLISDVENFLQGVARAEKNGFDKQGFNVEVKKENSGLYLVYNFLNADVWNEYLGVSNREPSIPEIEEEFFTYNIVTKSKTKFASTLTIAGVQTTFGEFVYREFEARVIGSMGVDVYNKLEEFPLSFSYATTSHRLHSDADEVVLINGYYVHTWNLSRSTIDREIKLYLTESNRGWWYLSALGISVIVVTGLIIGFYLFDKRRLSF